MEKKTLKPWDISRMMYCARNVYFQDNPEEMRKIINNIEKNVVNIIETCKELEFRPYQFRLQLEAEAIREGENLDLKNMEQRRQLINNLYEENLEAIAECMDYLNQIIDDFTQNGINIGPKFSTTEINSNLDASRVYFLAKDFMKGYADEPYLHMWCNGYENQTGKRLHINELFSAVTEHKYNEIIKDMMYKEEKDIAFKNRQDYKSKELSQEEIYEQYENKIKSKAKDLLIDSLIDNAINNSSSIKSTENEKIIIAEDNNGIRQGFKHSNEVESNPTVFSI